MAFGTKVRLAPLLFAGTTEPIASGTPSNIRVPSVGRVLITKLATVPSRSEPLSSTGMPSASSSPEPLAAFVSGASFSGVTVISSVELLPVLVT
ncbi:hypothetical protein FQZ97_828240 [compost metagenome]